jgi:hypothetical protein
MANLCYACRFCQEARRRLFAPKLWPRFNGACPPSAAILTLLAKRTEKDFQTWRDHQAWMAEKYRRFDRGERMPHDWRPGA